MGGRGSRSKLKNPEPQPEPQVSPAVKALRSATTLKELAQAAEQHLGIKEDTRMTDPNLSANIDLETYRESLVSASELIDEFPDLRGHITVVNASAIGAIEDETYAASNGTRIRLNESWFGDRQKFENSVAADVRSHYHPENSDYRDILVHEIAHNLEQRLIDRDQKLSIMDQFMAWKNHTKAQGVVQEAARAVRKQEKAAGLKTSSTTSMRERISNYALQNDAETLAEAVVDYMRNREKAAPLSQEIWKVLKRELK